MLADEITGAEAVRLGLANQCVPAAQFEGAVSQLAHRLATAPRGLWPDEAAAQSFPGGRLEENLSLERHCSNRPLRRQIFAKGNGLFAEA